MYAPVTFSVLGAKSPQHPVLNQCSDFMVTKHVSFYVYGIDPGGWVISGRMWE
jgi:hypothetical protein